MKVKMDNNTNLKIAKTVSVIFNPLFIPLFGLVIIFYSPTLFWYIPSVVKLMIFITVIFNNIMIPLLLISFIRKRHIKIPLGNEEASERAIPLILVSVLYLLTSFILLKLHIPLFLKAYCNSLSILALILLVITLRWKVSLYSAGAGSLVAIVLVLSLKMSTGLPVILAISVMVSGLVLSSRLMLDEHNPAEAYAGFLTGFLTIGSLMLIFQ